MRGWYVPTRPDEHPGESTVWYACFWEFCAAYLRERFDQDWCLSPEQSLLLHTGNRAVPRQLLVRAPKGGNKVTALPHETSLLDVRAAMPQSGDMVEYEGLRLYALPAALVACGARFFLQNPTEARAALAMVRNASDVLEPLLGGGHSTVAGRLAGAFRNIGREAIADDIVNTMRAAGYMVREQDPFAYQGHILGPREVSPSANRLRLMWADMRGTILNVFPQAPGLPADPLHYLERVAEEYGNDAYHSLSIEGYRVSPELIERVRSGGWNPDHDARDRAHRDALAARGYWQAHQVVRASIQRVLQGENAGSVVEQDHGRWYRELFTPSVTAGLARSRDLAGYRNAPVYIRRSMHVPPSPDQVRDMMPTFTDLLSEETEAAVRVVLGHFIFVYIHPYMDGNGRIGRFLMNLMLASGGYPWTIVPLERREDYMGALERASVDQDIEPFATFLASLVQRTLKRWR